MADNFKERHRGAKVDPSPLSAFLKFSSKRGGNYDRYRSAAMPTVRSSAARMTALAINRAMMPTLRDSIPDNQTLGLLPKFAQKALDVNKIATAYPVMICGLNWF